MGSSVVQFSAADWTPAPKTAPLLFLHPYHTFISLTYRLKRTVAKLREGWRLAA